MRVAVGVAYAGRDYRDFRLHPPQEFFGGGIAGAVVARFKRVGFQAGFEDAGHGVLYRGFGVAHEQQPGAVVIEADHQGTVVVLVVVMDDDRLVAGIQHFHRHPGIEVQLVAGFGEMGSAAGLGRGQLAQIVVARGVPVLGLGVVEVFHAERVENLLQPAVMVAVRVGEQHVVYGGHALFLEEFFYGRPGGAAVDQYIVAVGQFYVGGVALADVDVVNVQLGPEIG